MIRSLEKLQEQNGLKINAYANPGGPTERAINNRLLGKPRGAGLLFDPPAPISGKVGDGFENRREDVANIKRILGALNHIPEDPYDSPSGFIDATTVHGIRNFQEQNGLTNDGWLAPGGETERALRDAVADLARAKGGEWLQFAKRAGRAQARIMARGNDDLESTGGEETFASPTNDETELPSAVPVKWEPWDITRRMWETDDLPGMSGMRGGRIRPGPGPGAPSRPVPPPPLVPPLTQRSADGEHSGGKTELIPPPVDDDPFRGSDPTKPPLDPKLMRPSPSPSEPPLKLPAREEIQPEMLKPEDWTLITPAIRPWSASDLVLLNRGNSRTQDRLTGMREVGEEVAKERGDVKLVHIGGARDQLGINTKEYYARNPLKKHLGIKTTAGSALADLTFQDIPTGNLYHISLYRVTSGTNPRKEEVAQAIKLAVNTEGKTQLIVMVPNVRGDNFVDAEAFKRFLHATLDSLRGAPKVTDMSDPTARERVIRYFKELKPK